MTLLRLRLLQYQEYLMGPKERKVREKEQRRIEIIKAGEKLFLTKGLAGATMEEIARKCELSKGTLYLYFKSKEQLFLEIVVLAMEDLYSVMEKEINEGKTPVDKLVRSGKAYYTFFRKNPGYFRILARMIDIEHDFIGDLGNQGLELIAINNNLWGLLTAVIQEGIRGGIFKEDTDPLEIAISLYAASTTILRMIDHIDTDKAKIIRLKADHPLRVMFRDMKAHTDINLEKTYFNLGRRIIESIMTSPSDLQKLTEKTPKIKGAKK